MSPVASDGITRSALGESRTRILPFRKGVPWPLGYKRSVLSGGVEPPHQPSEDRVAIRTRERSVLGGTRTPNARFVAERDIRFTTRTNKRSCTQRGAGFG